MSRALVRRLRLPPAATSPAHARSEVALLLADAGLEDMLDEALLLTSELVTNGVIHAGTDIELELVADPDSLRVMVTDFAPTDADAIINELRRPPRPVAEGGRGLLLVSTFATRWGMSHERDGRTVWFQIDRPGLSTAARPRGLASQPARPAPPIDELLDEVIGRPHATNGQRPAHYLTSGSDRDGRLTDLVTRLARGLGAGTATVSIDQADGRGSQVVVRCTAVEPDAPHGRTVRVPLPLSRPWTGEFIATGVRGRHAEPVTALTARQLALMIENQRLEEAHNSGRGWLLFLAEAGELLAQTMSVDLTVALIPRLVVPRLGLWCAVHLRNEYGELTPAALTHANESAISALSVQLNAQLSRLAKVRAGAGASPLAPVDAMTFPLAVRAECFGTLTVGRPDGRPHDQDELAIVEDLARRAAIAIENARIHQHRSTIASTLQQALLPPELPQIDGLEVAAEYVPAGDGIDVGGDFYDVVALPDGGWLLVVGDVSGKGVAAAAVTGLVREVLHTLAGEKHLEPEHTLRRLNASLVERGGGYYCTLALAFLTPATPHGFDLTLHLAGHDQPVLLRADATISMIGTGGTALGLLDAIKTPRTTIQLNSGDTVVFYTDGITERRRGTTLYGQQRLSEQIGALAGAPASVIAAQLRASVLAFSSQPPRDDIAIVALQVR